MQRSQVPAAGVRTVVAVRASATAWGDHLAKSPTLKLGLPLSTLLTGTRVHGRISRMEGRRSTRRLCRCSWLARGKWRLLIGRLAREIASNGLEAVQKRAFVL
jgi:hypothetical protein